MDTKRKLTPRSTPVQKRALERREEILQVTARLLEAVGQDDLTTILVAKTVGVSVGTLYHYFPNKYAIMYALAERWLDEMDNGLRELEGYPIESFGLKQFVETSTDRMLLTYQQQEGLLPLVQAMYGVPELKALDNQHDATIISAMARMFKRLEISNHTSELERLGREWLEISHALLLVIVHQGNVDAERSLADLKFLSLCLLERAKGQF
ncbi:MAG: TetR/AcrR family transcriptional regulator [Porticoccaceae bacterium]|nr:TetR/AcrR family transcriptional regulator [Porticoccaceae bacterium]MDG1473930.1 TetR/AcrR family transcriptional regulator [Porticoccaceae bacterium]